MLVLMLLLLLLPFRRGGVKWMNHFLFPIYSKKLSKSLSPLVVFVILADVVFSVGFTYQLCVCMWVRVAVCRYLVFILFVCLTFVILITFCFYHHFVAPAKQVYILFIIHPLPLSVSHVSFYNRTIIPTICSSFWYTVEVCVRGVQCRRGFTVFKTALQVCTVNAVVVV